MPSDRAGLVAKGVLAVPIGAMIALAAALGIGRFVYTPILPIMAEALRLSKSQAGLIASANFAGYLAGALLATLPYFTASRRQWLLGGLIVIAITMIAMALTSSMAAFLALRFICGVASAFVLVFVSALVIDFLAHNGRSDLSAFHFAGVGVGVALSALLVAGLSAAGGNWRMLWLVSGAVAGAAAPVCAWLIPSAESGGSAPPSHSKPERGMPGGLVAITACSGLFGFGYVVTATFIVAVVAKSPKAGLLETVVWLLVGLSAIPSITVWSRIAAGRLGAFGSYGLACAVEAIGIAAGGVWNTPAGALIAAFLLGGTFMGITALGFVVARGFAPEQPQRAFAVITAGFGLGQVIGPIIAGFLLDKTGSFAAPSLIAASALAVAALLAAAGSRSLARIQP